MHQEQTSQDINKMFHQMGVLLLLDVPEGLQFGIDNMSWQVGQKFKGIKLIPLGVHIITYSLKNQNFMFPIKKFMYFGPSKNNKDSQRIHIYRWHKQLQKFMQVKHEEAEGYREGVRKYHFDCYLGPYPSQNIQFWKANTRYISKQVLEKLEPIQWSAKHQEQYNKEGDKQVEEERYDIDSESDGEKQQKIQEEDDDDEIDEVDKVKQKQSDKKQKQKKGCELDGNIYYSQIPRRLTQDSNHTSSINIDRSQILTSLIKNQWPNNQFDILGELQYSFIAFLVGQCLDSYNQWKQLMTLLCLSEKAYRDRKELMLEFLIVFYDQLAQFPVDFFIDELAKDNFLTVCLKSLRIYQKQKTPGKKMISRIQKILHFVQQKFQYYPCSDEQESPMVVEANQSYF